MSRATVTAPARTASAWRVWAIPRRRSGRLVLRAPLTPHPWTDWEHHAVCPKPSWAWTQEDWDARPERHAPPGADCRCGIRGVVDLGELLDYCDNLHRAIHSDLVLGRVTLVGRILGPSPRDDDTPTTLRAERAFIGRQFYFPRPQWGRIVAFERDYPHSRADRVEKLRDVLAYA